MFKVGQKIVCINNSGAEELIQNEIYEIFYIIPDENGTLGFVLVGFDPYDAYYNWRFRKLDDQFANDLLAKITGEMYQECLIKEEVL